MDEIAKKVIIAKPDLKTKKDFEELITKDQAAEMADFMWLIYLVGLIVNANCDRLQFPHYFAL